MTKEKGYLDLHIVHETGIISCTLPEGIYKEELWLPRIGKFSDKQDTAELPKIESGCGLDITQVFPNLVALNVSRGSALLSSFELLLLHSFTLLNLRSFALICMFLPPTAFRTTSGNCRHTILFCTMFFETLQVMDVCTTES